MRKSSTPGQLLSVDAMCGRDLVPAAKQLLRTAPKGENGFSTWDASSIFFELDGLKTKEHASARTLLLLYAADLRFRLRWEIVPALDEGQTVVATPYIETGVAFGLAMGLPQQWLDEVFRFAPKASAAFWINGTPAARAASTAGFLEFCSHFVGRDFFEEVGNHFDDLERRGKCRTFPPRQ